jgi:hypothetical protein
MLQHDSCHCGCVCLPAALLSHRRQSDVSNLWHGRHVQQALLGPGLNQRQVDHQPTGIQLAAPALGGIMIPSNMLVLKQTFGAHFGR